MGGSPPCDYLALGWEVLLDQAKGWAPEAFTQPARTCLSCKLLRQRTAQSDVRAAGDVAPIEPPAPVAGETALALASWGLHAWSPFCKPQQDIPDKVKVPGARLVAREVFAGSARWTQDWTSRGQAAQEPVEYFEDPINRKGPREEYNLLDPKVQEGLLDEIDHGETNVWGFEPVCTSFCSWMRLNGGTRTFDHPEGVEPLKPGERDGNSHARFTAQAFERALDRGQFPWAENPAPDGIYPSMWDMQEWRRILARKDVMIVPFDFCEHGHGPEDDPEARYRKRT